MSPRATQEAPKPPVILAERLALVDAVDHLLNRGAVLVGDATLSLAGVDLVYVGLSVLVSSVETLRRELPETRQDPAARRDDPPRLGGVSATLGRPDQSAPVAEPLFSVSPRLTTSAEPAVPTSL